MSTKRGFVKKNFFFTIFTMFLFRPDLNMQIIFICNLSPKINIKNLKNLLILKGWSINEFRKGKKKKKTKKFNKLLKYFHKIKIKIFKKLFNKKKNNFN